MLRIVVYLIEYYHNNNLLPYSATDLWCGVVGLVHFLGNIALALLFIILSPPEGEAVRLAYIMGAVSNAIIMFLWISENNAKATLHEVNNAYISANLDKINRFPEYIPDQHGEVVEILNRAGFSNSIKERITALVEKYISQTSSITRSQLIVKLRDSVNPQYDLEYALDRQLPGKQLAVKLDDALTQLSRSVSPVMIYHPQGRPLSELVNFASVPGLPKELAEEVKSITVRLAIPDNLRTTHHQIISASGHGKTSLIQSMILDDLEEDAAIVVIDSQNRMINELAQVVPENRLILIDPEHCPPALNIFANAGTNEKSVANALQLYEYIFSALEAGMTSKQTLVYRYLSRLCMVVPGASLATMRDMLQVDGIAPYYRYVEQLGDNAKTFFSEFMLPKNQYNETRQEVLRRLITVLESDTFARMLGARENKLDLAGALDQGKVVLISTNKELLKGNAALLGRIFLAQVMQAVMSWQQGKRVYLYVDEFKDYAEDSDILLDLFSQSRKYNMAMVVCHQELSQLTPKLAATISTNTSIKMVGGVSHEDAAKMAKQIQTEPRSIERLNVGQFMAWFKGVGTMYWSIDPDRLAKTPKRNNLDHIRRIMRERYGEGSKSPSAPPSPTSSPSAPVAPPAPQAPDKLKPTFWVVSGEGKGKELKDGDEESSPW